MNIINCYTDGACKNNKNAKKQKLDGGSGGIIILEKSNIKFMKKINNATNNIAELTAILECLKILDNNNFHKEIITIYTDSMYSLNSLTKWYKNWEKNNWKKSDGKEISNKQLIQNILVFLKKFDNISFKHVKGHSDNKYNNLADEYANKALELDNYEVCIEEK